MANMHSKYHDNMVITGAEHLVQGTNDYSTISKCSTAQYGYTSDGYITSLMPFTHRRSPLIHMGYYVRVVVVDAVLQEFFQLTRGNNAQVVSLGAGYDSTFFRLKGSESLHEGIVFYEVDFQDVVEKKAASIHQSSTLTQVAGCLAGHSDVGFGGDRYWLITCDLRNLSSFEEKIVHTSIDFSLPTLFLAECSITYMDERSSSALIRWAANKFPHATFVTYEQVYPTDGFGVVMENHFLNQGSPLQSLHHFPNLHAQERRYVTRGWAQCYARSVWDVYTHVTNFEELSRVLRIEPFDEFEEWHLKCCHYVLAVASQGQLEHWADNLLASVPLPEGAGAVGVVQWTEYDVAPAAGSGLPANIERFAHATTTIPVEDEGRPGAVLVLGGFGVSSTGHRRLEEVSLVDLTSDKHPNDASAIHCEVEQSGKGKVHLAAMHMSCTALHHNKESIMARVLLYGGRLAPSKGVNASGALLNVPVARSVARTGAMAVPLAQPGTVWDRPRARWRHSAVQIPPAGSQPWARVLLFGGRSSGYEVFGDLWLLTVASEVCRITFKKLEPTGDTPAARFSHSACALTERMGMAVSGGIGQNMAPLADVWLFDAGEKQWRLLQPEGPDPLPRYSHTSAVYQGLLVLVGGVNTLAGCQPGVAVINLRTRTCTEYALPTQDPQRPILLHGHTMEPLEEDGAVQLVVGGGGNCFSFGTAYNQSLLRFDLRQFLPPEPGTQPVSAAPS